MEVKKDFRGRIKVVNKINSVFFKFLMLQFEKKIACFINEYG